MTTPKRRHLPALMLGVMLSVPALAEPAGGPPPGERPCHADAMKYCADHVGNRDAMRACMRENQANFSQQCRDAMQARAQARMQGQQGKGQGGQGQGQQQKQPETQNTPKEGS